MSDFSGSDSVYSTDEFVPAAREYACARGTRGMLSLSFPRGATLHGPLSVDLTCPCCGEPVVIAGNAHYVDAAGRLVSE